MQDAGVYIHTHVGGSLDQVAGYEVAMPLDSESWTSWTEFSFLHGTQLKAFTETGDDDVSVLTIRLDGRVECTGMDTATEVGSTGSQYCNL